MPATGLLSTLTRPSIWLTAIALFGIAWNLFAAQFVGSVTATADSLIASGMTPDQAMVMTTYPNWMTLSFGLGVAAGLVGSILLLVKSALGRLVLAVSMFAYVALWIGDAFHGVFAAMGAPQIIILSLVVAIAVGLYVSSRYFSVQR